MCIKEIGGAMIGGLIPWRVSYPFATLTSDSEAIGLEVEFPFYERKYVIPKEDVSGIAEYEFVFSTGLRICHNRTDLPELLVFYHGRWETIKQALCDLGYKLIPSWEVGPRI
jgi:hypothetical protein